MHFLSNDRLILVLLGLTWIEVSVLPIFSSFGVKPDLFLVFLVFYALRIDRKRIVTLAFLLGLVKDLFTNSFFGLETASYVSGALLLQFLAMRFDREERWMQLVILFSFSWFTLILFSVFALLIQEPYGFHFGTVSKTLMISVSTTALGWLAFPLLERWLKPRLRERQYELF